MKNNGVIFSIGNIKMKTREEVSVNKDHLPYYCSDSIKRKARIVLKNRFSKVKIINKAKYNNSQKMWCGEAICNGREIKWSLGSI
ncbi:MAG: hypothetical protein PHE88_02365 [Elusimicrobia bacterium]|nr:hypothetical protein [Elusimicrobiota bacterium]